VVAAATAFMLAAWGLNPLCFYLSPVALIWVLAYSLTKRFTSWSHLWLGGSLAIAPVGGYLAVAGAWSTPAWTLHTLAASVAAWVAGFDIFYALQDESFDREHDLRSAVVLLGNKRSITLAKILHYISLGGLIAFGIGANLEWPYFAAIAASVAWIAWEHRLVRPGDLSRLNAAFFTANGVVSILVFIGALGDRLLP